MDLLEKIFDAGIVGAGGAGFPTHVKLNCSVEYFIVNAAECEPLLYTDKYIMKTFPREVVVAVTEVAKKVSAKETYIAVKKVNEHEIECLQKAITELQSPVKIFPLENYYPAGDEQMIVYDVTKRTVPPGGIPLHVGVAVSNVATMLGVYDALSDIPVTHKYVTVGGEVHVPSVLKVPIGISFKECIERCGGTKIDNFKIISGGPMMGKVFGPSGLDTQVVTKTTSGIIVIKDTGNFIARLSDTSVKQILNRAKSACIQCSFCTDLCPRQLIGHSLRPHRVMRHMSSMDFEKQLVEDDIVKEALICCECGVCETYACPMGLSPRQVNMFVKKQLAGKKFVSKTNEYKASAFREHRKVAPAKIMSHMGLAHLYENKNKGFAELTTNTVKIPLRQHIGSPSAPCVTVGDVVVVGQMIGKATGAVSANVHASIAGEVVNIGDSVEIRGGV